MKRMIKASKDYYRDQSGEIFSLDQLKKSYLANMESHPGTTFTQWFDDCIANGYLSKVDSMTAKFEHLYSLGVDSDENNKIYDQMNDIFDKYDEHSDNVSILFEMASDDDKKTLWSLVMKLQH